MTTARLICLLLLGFGFRLTAHAGPETPEDLFQQANVLAAEGAYAEAIPLYQTALEQLSTANLHYNLGNAFYQTTNWGQARLHWEKTLAIDPRNASARHNLDRLLQEQDLQPIPAKFSGFIQLLSLTQWTWLGGLTFWGLVIVILRIRWKNPRVLYPVGILCALLALVSLTAVLLTRPDFADAIILSEKNSLHVAPISNSPLTTKLRAGQWVHIQETHGEYVRIRLSDGQDGFLPSSQLAAIRHP